MLSCAARSHSHKQRKYAASAVLIVAILKNVKSQACKSIPCDDVNTPHSFVHQSADCFDFKYSNVMPMVRCIRIDFVIDRNAMRI